MCSKENAGKEAMKFLTAASWLHEGVPQARRTHTNVFVPPCGERPRGLFEKRQVSFAACLKAGGPHCRKQKTTWSECPLTYRGPRCSRLSCFRIDEYFIDCNCLLIKGGQLHDSTIITTFAGMSKSREKLGKVIFHWTPKNITKIFVIFCYVINDFLQKRNESNFRKEAKRI